MLKNASVTAFNISELWRDNQQNGGDGKITPTPPRLGLRKSVKQKKKRKTIRFQKQVRKRRPRINQVYKYFWNLFL